MAAPIPTPPNDPAPGAPRLDALDALRTGAMLWMTLYHLCYDLNHFGFARFAMLSDPYWTLQRTGIVSLFLFCAGLGQGLAVADGQGWPRFWRRWTQVAGCALLVSLASWWMFPASYIHFGVLHGLAIMLVVVRLTARWGAALWGLGALAITLPPLAGAWLAQPEQAALAEALNTRLWNGLGLVTRKPHTEDYVPLLPWMGVVWWGAAVAALPGLRRRLQRWSAHPGLRRLAGPGRWSLSYYMLHQPVLMGLLMVA